MTEAAKPNALTAVAYSSIAFGSVFAGVGAAVLVKFGPEVFSPEPDDLFEARFQFAFVLIAYGAAFLFVHGLVLLFAALGVLSRRRWGQVLTIVAAAIELLVFFPALPFAVLDPEAHREPVSVPVFVVSLVVVVHAVFCLVVLTRWRREFRKRAASDADRLAAAQR